MIRTIAVVGASLAGLSAARALREQGFDGRVVLIGEEAHRPYDRPPLSKSFLAGRATAEDIGLSVADDETLAVDWRLGTRAVRLDPTSAAVWLSSGEELRCDGLVIATGARARQLTGAGTLTGVHSLRTLDDAVALRADLLPGTRLVVIGAGFIGAEAASTARGLGVDVTVVETESVPMAGQLGPVIGSICAALHGSNGVRLLTGVGVRGLIGATSVEGVRLVDGRELPADVVLVGIGARPNVEWLTGSGLDLADGVVTDARCATKVPQVVAVGDCAASYNTHAGRLLRVEHWTNALEQPSVGVATLLAGHGGTAASTAVPYFWSDQYGVRIQFAGHQRPGDTLRVIEGEPWDGVFLAVYERAGRLVAVLAMNQAKLFGRLRRQLGAHLT